MSFRSGNRGRPDVPTLPPQPAPQEMMDIIDEISGTQTVTVTGADGRKRRVTQRLPRTPQEQKMFEEAETLMSQAVSNIQALYQYDPASVADYQPFIQTFAEVNNERMADLARIGNFGDIANKVTQFKDMQRSLVAREFDKRERMAENNLAARGLGNSTQAAEEKAFMARDRALTEAEVDVNANMYGEDLAARQLNREMGAYQAQDVGRQSRLDKAGAEFEMARQKTADEEMRRQNAINENLTHIELGNNQRDIEFRRAQLGQGGEALAQNATNSANANANARYTSNVNTLTNQYAMNLKAFNSRRPTFGQRLTDVGLAAVGKAAGAAASRFTGGTPAAT